MMELYKLRCESLHRINAPYKSGQKQAFVLESSTYYGVTYNKDRITP